MLCVDRDFCFASSLPLPGATLHNTNQKPQGVFTPWFFLYPPARSNMFGSQLGIKKPENLFSGF